MLKIKGHRAQRGVTVAELVVVITIISILVTMAGFTIVGSIRQSRLKETTRDLEGVISTIRNTARTQQRHVVMTLTTTSPSGVSAFVDVNGNGALDAGDTSLFSHTLSQDVQLAVTSTGAGAVAPLTTVRFNEMGNIVDANRLITLSISSDANLRYRIWIYSTGSTMVVRSDNGGTTWPTRPW